VVIHSSTDHFILFELRNGELDERIWEVDQVRVVELGRRKIEVQVVPDPGKEPPREVVAEKAVPSTFITGPTMLLHP
jgi:hypothetical protein